MPRKPKRVIETYLRVPEPRPPHEREIGIPFPKYAAKAIDKMLAAAVSVEEGLLRDEREEISARAELPPYTAEEVMEYLDVGWVTLWKLQRAGLLNPVRIEADKDRQVGHKKGILRRYDREEVEALHVERMTERAGRKKRGTPRKQARPTKPKEGTPA